jgi:2-methylcitrate dehydratase PrpD
MNRKVTDALLDFAFKFSHYDALPENVTHEAKRILIDGIGNILGGIASDKGKIGIALAKKMGGTLSLH